MMNKIIKQISRLPIALIPLVLFCITFSSCNEGDDGDDVMGDWGIVTPFGGAPRSGAVQFTIGSKVYVGLGYNPNSADDEEEDELVKDGYFNDVYVFDGDNWSRIALFPGDRRERAVAFSIGNYGYVGLGYNRKLDKRELRDIWRYDPAEDEWTKMDAEFLGSARYNAIAFSINGKGYVGTGKDASGNYTGDFYEYEPGTDTWTQIASLKGQKREAAFAFVINNKAYVGGGLNNDSYTTDFFEFDPTKLGTTDGPWTSLENTDDDDNNYDEYIAAVQRYDAVTMVLNDKGRAYVATGIAGGAISKSVYEFNPEGAEWTEMTSFEGNARSLAVGFVISNRIYLGTGQYNTSRYDDIWEFAPEEDDDDNRYL